MLFSDLAHLPLWVKWRFEKAPGTDRPTKVPYLPRAPEIPTAGHKAKSNDSKGWGLKGELTLEGYEGPGIMFGTVDLWHNLGGVDLDECIDADGIVAPWAVEIIDLCNSYTEISPSGHGLKIYFTHDPEVTLRPEHRWRHEVKRPTANGADKAPGIEFYLRGRYFCATDRVYGTCLEVRELDWETLQAIQTAMNVFSPEKARTMAPENAPGNGTARLWDERAARQLKLIDAAEQIPNPGLPWDEWSRIGMAIHANVEDRIRGFDLFVRFSQRSSKFSYDACVERWNHWDHSPATQLGPGTIVYLGRNSQQIAEKQAQPADWLGRFNVSRWTGRTAPEIEFTIEDMMPEGVAVLLAGDGGAGKSILGQLMATCIAAQHPFLGKKTKPGSALYLTAEDSETIAWNRQVKINETVAVTMKDLEGKLYIASVADEDFVLFSDGKPTAAEGELDRGLGENPDIRMVVIDSASLVYDDDEIKRRPVSAFMRRLNRLAARHRVTVVLIAHTSRSSDGTVAKLASGSTGWVYGSRGGFLLTRQEDGSLEFALVKPQYTAPFKMPLAMNDHFVPVLRESLSGVLASISKKALDRRLMEAIVKGWNNGYPFTSAPQSERYLPAYMARNTGMKTQDAKEAMTRLIDSGDVIRQRHKSKLEGLCPKDPDAWK